MKKASDSWLKQASDSIGKESPVRREMLQVFADEGKKTIPTQESRCGDYYSELPVKEDRLNLTASEYSNVVLVIGSSVMGCGDDHQGSRLMNSFLYTVARRENVPGTIILLNSGVYLAGEGSASLDYLQLLEERGTEVICNESCLKYYGLEDKLGVGNISNMYSITEKIFEASRLIAI